MTKNFFKIDTKKDDIIFNQDYIIINGCLMFHKTVACIGLDTELLQDKINNNTPFNYKDKNFISELPLCEKLLPEGFIKNLETYTEYKNTGLTQLKNNKKGNDYQLFINNSNNCIIALNKRYSDFIIENDLKIWGTKENCFTLVLSDYQKNIKGLICRCERWQNYDVERFFKNILIHNRNSDTITDLKDFDDFKKNNSLKNNQVIDY